MMSVLPETTRRGSILFTLRVALSLIVLLPVLRLRLALSTDEARAHALVRRCAQSVLRLAGCRVHLTNVDRVPQHGHIMLVSNHVSLADAAVLLACVPGDFRFVANHVFAQYPVLGAAIRATSAHIVDRGSWRSRAECGDAMTGNLADGRSLLVFPEGTTADDGRMRPFRNGAFRAAARSQRPIVPLAISGTREMFPSGAWLLSNTPVAIDVLPPLEAADATRESIADLRNRTAAAIAAQVDLRSQNVLRATHSRSSESPTT